MTSQTGKDRFDWRRVIVGGVATSALAVGILAGVGVTTASAQPADPAGPTAADDNCTGDDCSKDEAEAAAAAAGCEEDDKKCADAASAPKRINADAVLSQIYEEYRQGDGGGQISILIDDVMKLRAQGFRPSAANALALEDAMAHRPNQGPIVEALKETLGYQRKLQAQSQMSAAQQGPIAGPVPAIPGGPGGGAPIQVPQGTMTIPLGPR